VSELLVSSSKLPPEQHAIRAKCFHPSGTFVEFSKEEFEQSIPERFEKIACRYSKQLAIKVGNTFLTYGELNEEANRIAHPILNSVGEGFDGHGALTVTAILGALKPVKYTCRSTGLVLLKDFETKRSLERAATEHTKLIRPHIHSRRSAGDWS